MTELCSPVTVSQSVLGRTFVDERDSILSIFPSKASNQISQIYVVKLKTSGLLQWCQSVSEVSKRIQPRRENSFLDSHNLSILAIPREGKTDLLNGVCCLRANLGKCSQRQSSDEGSLCATLGLSRKPQDETLGCQVSRWRYDDARNWLQELKRQNLTKFDKKDGKGQKKNSGWSTYGCWLWQFWQARTAKWPPKQVQSTMRFDKKVRTIELRFQVFTSFLFEAPNRRYKKNPKDYINAFLNMYIDIEVIRLGKCWSCVIEKL